MPIPREQLRLEPHELDAMMSSAHELHVATVSPDGMPHVVPLWFVWHGDAIWVNSLRRSRRARDLAAGSPVAVCIDAGTEYQELRGAVFYGRFVEVEDDARLEEIRLAFSAKYWGGVDVPSLRSHVWLRLAVDRVASWDFRRIPQGRDKRLEATRDRPE